MVEILVIGNAVFGKFMGEKPPLLVLDNTAGFRSATVLAGALF
jgi:hypothetical protein